MKRSVHGKDPNTHYVCCLLPGTESTDSLLAVEVITPSSHASLRRTTTAQTIFRKKACWKRLIYHRLNPAQGFAFQRVYTHDRSIDEAMAVEDHDERMMPRGYHPVVAVYSFDSYYLNGLSGPKRERHFKNDPAHE